MGLGPNGAVHRAVWALRMRTAAYYTLAFLGNKNGDPYRAVGRMPDVGAADHFLADVQRLGQKPD